jgi:putative tryptophan/tyrosine transport system substrate-binding protein
LNRRQAAFGLAALLVAGTSGAQSQGKVWRIGFLTPNRRPASLQAHRFGGLLQGLRELGYVEGTNLAIEWSFADDVYSLLPTMAAELVALRVDVIIAGGTAATRAAQKATSSIPIVMLGVGDPVASRLVSSLARPGANTTGSSTVSRDLSAKWLEIARSIVPAMSRIGVLLNAGNPARTVTLDGLRKAAAASSVAVVPFEVRGVTDFDAAFQQMKQERTQGLVIQNEAMLRDASAAIARFAMQARLPSVSGGHEFAEAGCLVSYGSNLFDLYRNVARQVDKILRGAKPGDLPVEQPTSYELVVNLRTAKALGLSLPKELVLRADRTIA